MQLEEVAIEKFPRIGRYKKFSERLKMPARRIAGRIYEEIAVRAEEALPMIAGLSIPEHDHVDLSYDISDNLIGVEYKIGGVWVGSPTNTYTGGTTVGELELVYDGSNNLTKVTRVQ